MWPRAAAILGRQALEEQLLGHLGEELSQCPLRAQFLLVDDKLGRQRAGELANAYDCFKWEELVAGILRGMGYRTRRSDKGADRGHDIFASPDGLGLQEPRIFVEVKHRKGIMGAPSIRSFLGGRSHGDRPA